MPVSIFIHMESLIELDWTLNFQRNNSVDLNNCVFLAPVNFNSTVMLQKLIQCMPQMIFLLFISISASSSESIHHYGHFSLDTLTLL